MKSKRFVYFLLILLVLGLLSYLYPTLTGHATSANNYYSSETAILNRVIDGDTIVVTGEAIGNNTHIRMLGINTPEKTMPHASEAAEFLKQFEGKTITILRDKEDTDKYNRKLRYVYYNDRFLNKEILQQGLANSYYTKGLIYEKELLASEKQARLNALGIWQKSQEKCATKNCIILEKLEPKEEFFTIKNSCSFICSLSSWFVKDAGRNTFQLSALNSGQEKTYSSEGKEIWNNDHDNFFMFDEKGLIVIYYEY